MQYNPNEVASKTDELKNKARDKVEVGASVIEDKLKNAKNVANEAIHKAQENVAEWTDSFKDQIKGSPLLALGIAALVGITLGVLISK